MKGKPLERTFKLRRYLQAHRWQIVLALFAVCFGLGYTGFYKYTRAIGSDHSPTDLIYLTIQLAKFSSGAVSGPVGWELNVARFLTPLVAAYSAVIAVASLFRKQLDLLRLRTMRRHTIICGLGEKGWLLASRLQENGREVVVIENNPGCARIELCREMGIIVLERDAREPVNLERANINRADYLVAVCGSDSANAEIAAAARQISARRKSGALNCTIHVVNPQLCDLLRELEFGFDTFPTFRLEMFNIFERGARILVSEYLAFDRELKPGQESAHMLVVGCGELGESLVLQAARSWFENWKEGGARLNITVVDRNAADRVDPLRIRFPKLEKCCQVNTLDVDVENPGTHSADFLFDESGRSLFSPIFICMDNTSSGLKAALRLRQRLDCSQPPIILYMPEESGLAKLLTDEPHSDIPVHNIIPFRLVQSTCTPDLVIDGTHRILAQAVHEDYLRLRLADGVQMGQKRSMVSWDELPEDLRESNYRQVDHIRLKLHEIGCGIKPLRDWEAAEFQFSPAEIEKMARMEHDHWMEERRRDGWRTAPGFEDARNKTHPDLVPWDRLPEAAKEKDRQPGQALPKILARAGFQVFRWKQN